MPNREPPLPEEPLHMMVGHATFKQEHLFALSLLVGFYATPRTGEILGIRQLARNFVLRPISGGNSLILL